MKNEHDIDKMGNQMDHPDNFPLWCVALIAGVLACFGVVIFVCALGFLVMPLLKLIFTGVL